MIIRCLYNSSKELYNPDVPDRNYLWHDVKDYLTPGKLYIVYGITYFDKVVPSKRHFSMDDLIWYGDFSYKIVDDYGSPSYAYSRLFEVVCPHLHGVGWCFQHYRNSVYYSASGSLSFEHFVVDPQYADRLTLLDASKAERLEWLKWKEHIDKANVEAKCGCCDDVQSIIRSTPFNYSYIRDPLSDDGVVE